VGLFIPCFIDLFDPQVGIDTVRVLEHVGVEPCYPTEQTCCGQPHFNAGHWAAARELAERFGRVFGPYPTVVTPSGSCASMVRTHYPTLLGDDAVSKRVYELCELLVDRLGVTKLGARLAGRAALHVGCHARRELGATSAVEKLVDEVDGLRRVELSSDTWCCGFGGTFAVKFPEVSTAMGERKLEPMLEADVDYVISTDTSCLLHLGGMLAHRNLRRPRPLHVAQVLATAVEAP
jgi:L-lactate dehydrogenase complex protein LldE